MKKHFLLLALLISLISVNSFAKSYQDEFGWLSESKLSNADLVDRSSEELSLMKGAIYAKYGYIFKDTQNSEYFSNCDWYEGICDNEFIAYSQMSEIEQYNVGLININSHDAKVVNVQYGYYDFPYEIITRKLTMSDLRGLDCEDLRILRNAIYAYHGYIFTSKDLKRYFSQFAWYDPITSNQNRVYSSFSKIEKYNIELIQKRERQLGC